MPSLHSAKEFVSDHPIIAGVVGYFLYERCYILVVSYLIKHYSNGCKIEGYFARRGYRRYLSCEFDVAPGVDFLLDLVVSGGLFFGPLIAAFVICIPLTFLIFLYRRIAGEKEMPSIVDPKN